MSHHPTLMSSGRHGSWCRCSCGWESGIYMFVTGAHLAFGRHLIAVAQPVTRTTPTEEPK